MKPADLPVPPADSPPLTLADLRKGEAAVVLGLGPVTGLDDGQAQLLAGRLRDLGFVTGARCEVVARMWPGGEPIAVRIGGSSFALRRVEARAVRLKHGGPMIDAARPAAAAHVDPT